MSVQSEKTGIPFIIFLILVVIGIYLLYLLVLFMARVFVFCGFNALFYMDNLLEIPSFNPAVSWGVLGVLLGSLTGVFVAIRRYKLSRVLLFYPVGGILIIVGIMAVINKPGHYEVMAQVPGETSAAAPASDSSMTSTPHLRRLYRTTINLRVHDKPSTDSAVLFVVKKGVEVEILQRRVLYFSNTEWVKISYNGQEGFVSMRPLIFSKTATY